MISQVPSLQTNVIATVRRDPQPAVGDSQGAQRNNKQQESSFTLNADPKPEQASNSNDFAVGGAFNLASINGTAGNGGGSFSKSALRAASQAYAMAQAFTAISPDRAFSYAV